MQERRQLSSSPTKQAARYSVIDAEVQVPSPPCHWNRKKQCRSKAILQQEKNDQEDHSQIIRQARQSESRDANQIHCQRFRPQGRQ